MKRPLRRVVGTAMILAALWFVTGAAYGLMPVVWANALNLPKEEWVHLGRYGAWIDISIWVVWGLAIACTVWAIRVLFRRTKSMSRPD